ncbi:hypothetical protein V2J09_022798 [Rumex salicifolius]
MLIGLLLKKRMKKKIHPSMQMKFKYTKKLLLKIQARCKVLWQKISYLHH